MPIFGLTKLLGGLEATMGEEGGGEREDRGLGDVLGGKEIEAASTSGVHATGGDEDEKSAIL